MIIFVCLAAAQVDHPVFAANRTDEPKVLFQSDAVLNITLSAPFGDIFKNRGDERPYRPGKLQISEDGAIKNVGVKLRVRGKSRAESVLCRFPPLRVSFATEQTAGTVFDGQSKLKLVTHCQNTKKYQQYTYGEYLIYKIYNLLTPLSFRVRMARITYVDTEDAKTIAESHGFFIEDIDDVATRNGMARQKIIHPDLRNLDPYASARFALFQYMISNLDWAALAGPPGEDCCHNGRLIGTKGSGLIPVPYDFDQSGLMSTEYALPPTRLKVRNVRSRLYRGFCDHNAHLSAVISDFKANKDAIMALYRDMPQLNERTRERAMKFLTGFYAVVENPKRVNKSIIGKCRA